ncbi:MAG: nucleotidyl transferase AbiEii/AbiGii toxin family protein [Gammaproteobacteria bacterium]|nr:nucleotidyl transferase AbiEii/AbiGii toxin family protein [Gammaproteobacteria bacterium]
MIPVAQITQWRSVAPWPDDMQVEQDLILSRILVEIFSDPFLNKELAFRGGTALHKLFFSPPARYSEDIDLVRTSKGPITDIVDALRERLEPWLGKPKTVRTIRSFKMMFYFNPENLPTSRLRIKIEINIQENFAVLDRLSKIFSVQSDWFLGSTKINTFQFDELIATKLRALYQRSKGRDVFDLWLALNQEDLNITNTIQVFEHYMKKENKIITRELFEKNLDLKLKEHSFLDDIGPLLSPDLKKTLSSSFITNDSGFTVTESKGPPVSEGWSLVDSAEEIRKKILVHLPK